MNNKVFSKISKNVFSIYDGEKFVYEGSVLSKADGKIIRIIHELMVGTDYRGLYKNSLNGLITDCKHIVNKYNKRDFDNLITIMHNNKYIKIIEKSKDRFVIDTDNLFNMAEEYGYTILEEKELNIIDNISNNNKTRNNLLKCYMFIKTMCHKRKDDSQADLIYNLETQSITMDYNYISKFTGIGNVYNCITMLKKHNLINYDNFLEAPINNKTAKRDSKNTYVVRALEEEGNTELMNEELKYAVKQYKKIREEERYVVSNKYINNNKAENGRKGRLKQLENK